MSFDKSRMSKLFGNIIGMNPQTVSIAPQGSQTSTQYRAAPTTLKSERRVELYGFDQQISHSFYFKNSDLPTDKKTLLDGILTDAAGNVFRIVGFEPDSLNAGTRIDVVDRYA